MFNIPSPVNLFYDSSQALAPLLKSSNLAVTRNRIKKMYIRLSINEDGSVKQVDEISDGESLTFAPDGAVTHFTVKLSRLPELHKVVSGKHSEFFEQLTSNEVNAYKLFARDYAENIYKDLVAKYDVQKDYVIVDTFWSNNGLHSHRLEKEVLQILGSQQLSKDGFVDAFGNMGEPIKKSINFGSPVGKISFASATKDKPSLARYGKRNHEVHNVSSTTLELCKAATEFLIRNNQIRFNSADDSYIGAYAESTSSEDVQDCALKEIDFFVEQFVEKPSKKNGGPSMDQKLLVLQEKAIDVLDILQKKQINPAEVNIKTFVFSKTNSIVNIKHYQENSYERFVNASTNWVEAVKKVEQIAYVDFPLRPVAPYFFMPLVGDTAILDIFFDPAKFNLENFFRRNKKEIYTHIMSPRSESRQHNVRKMIHFLFVINVLNGVEMESVGYKIGRILQLLGEIQQRYHKVLHNKTIANTHANTFIGKVASNTDYLATTIKRMHPILLFAKQRLPQLYIPFQTAMAELTEMAQPSLPKSLNSREEQMLLLGYYSRAPKTPSSQEDNTPVETGETVNV